MHRLPSLLPFRQRPPTQQRGVALFVVIVFVMLSMLLALWASRTSLFNEMVVGNDADYQRAFEAAQAMLQDAEQDVRLSNESPESSVLCTAGGDVCRSTTVDQFPLAKQQETIGQLLNTLSSVAAGCRSGLCTKREGKLDFWNNTDTANGPSLSQMLTAGARYGQYTGAKYGDPTKPANPILADRAAGKGAWYWIEVLPYDESTKTSNLIVGGARNLLNLNIDPNVVYRITALAYGRKPGTMVTMQQTYAPQRQKD